MKRTYRLPEEAVFLVRELVEDYHLAPTQDAVVEMAIADLAMAARHRADEDAYRRAAADPDMGDEGAEIARAFAAVQDESWPD